MTKQAGVVTNTRVKLKQTISTEYPCPYFLFPTRIVRNRDSTFICRQLSGENSRNTVQR